jgi:hypothetical protein
MDLFIDLQGREGRTWKVSKYYISVAVSVGVIKWNMR